jgi:hypothetical protein
LAGISKGEGIERDILRGQRWRVNTDMEATTIIVEVRHGVHGRGRGKNVDDSGGDTVASHAGKSR